MLQKPEGTLTALMASAWAHQSTSQQKYAIWAVSIHNLHIAYEIHATVATKCYKVIMRNYTINAFEKKI